MRKILPFVVATLLMAPATADAHQTTSVTVDKAAASRFVDNRLCDWPCRLFGVSPSLVRTTAHGRTFDVPVVHGVIWFRYCNMRVHVTHGVPRKTSYPQVCS